MFLRYEDLRDNYEETLDTIMKKFNLHRASDSIVKITKRVTPSNFNKRAKNIQCPISRETIYTHPSFDKQTELDLGYALE